jgi:hypothetical protein
MKQMVLMKPDGTYEEIDMTTDKITYFQSRGYKIYTWKEMFENTVEATTEKIMHLEGKLLGECHKVECNVAIVDELKENIHHKDVYIDHLKSEREYYRDLMEIGKDALKDIISEVGTSTKANKIAVNALNVIEPEAR